MAKPKFDMMKLLNDDSKSQADITDNGADNAPKTVSVFDIEPNELNFYSLKEDEIKELMEAIEIAGGVKQNLLLKENEPGSSYKYKCLAGHRRMKACINLYEEGKTQYEYVPVAIEKVEDDVKEELLVILTNKYRTKSDYEKVYEAARTRELLEVWKKENKVPGRIREMVAEVLSTTPAQISRYESIDKKLIVDLKDQFREEKINVTTAYETSKLDLEGQAKALEILETTGTLNTDDIRGIKQEQEKAKPIEGQEKLNEEYFPIVEEEETAKSVDEPEEERKTPQEVEAEKDNFILSVRTNCIFEQDHACNIKNLKEVAASLGIECKYNCCYSCDNKECGARCNFAAHNEPLKKQDKTPTPEAVPVAVAVKDNVTETGTKEEITYTLQEVMEYTKTVKDYYEKNIKEGQLKIAKRAKMQYDALNLLLESME